MLVVMGFCSMMDGQYFCVGCWVVGVFLFVVGFGKDFVVSVENYCVDGNVILCGGVVCYVKGLGYGLMLIWYWIGYRLVC